MKKYSCIILFLFINLTLFCKSLILEEITNPMTLRVNSQKIFIGEEFSVFIYSAESGRIIKISGKEGEGPGEFKKHHSRGSVDFFLRDKKLYINSFTKLSVFSSDGNLLSEQRTKPNHSFCPAGGNFVSGSKYTDSDLKTNLSISLFNSKFKKIKDLFLSKVRVGMGFKINLPRYIHKYKVRNRKIYVSTGRDKIEIKVFDLFGKYLYTFSHQIREREVNKQYRDEKTEIYKSSPRYKKRWHYYKKFIGFKDHFPALKNFFTDKNAIYVETYNQNRGKNLWLKFDYKGNFLKNIYIKNPFNNYEEEKPVDVYNGKLYYIYDNSEEDVMELKSIELN